MRLKRRRLRHPFSVYKMRTIIPTLSRNPGCQHVNSSKLCPCSFHFLLGLLTDSFSVHVNPPESTQICSFVIDFFRRALLEIRIALVRTKGQEKVWNWCHLKMQPYIQVIVNKKKKCQSDLGVVGGNRLQKEKNFIKQTQQYLNDCIS